jgi:hypothetical protein
MSEIPCALEENLSSAFIGAIVEGRQWKQSDRWMTATIQYVVQVRFNTLCPGTPNDAKEREMNAILETAESAEKSILSRLSSEIKPHELNGFFIIPPAKWRLVRSKGFQDIYALYSLRHGIEAANQMSLALSGIDGDNGLFLVIEYGRNKTGDVLFIQNISLNQEQAPDQEPAKTASNSWWESVK